MNHEFCFMMKDYSNLTQNLINIYFGPRGTEKDIIDNSH